MILAQDDFADGIIGPLWGGATPVRVTEIGGRLRTLLPSDYGCYIQTAASYNIASGTFVAIDMFSGGVIASGVEVYAAVDFGADNVAGWSFDGDTLYPYESVAGVSSSVSLAYDPVAHRRLRVRFEGGSTFWETSPDGSVWTTRRTKVSGFALAAAIFSISCGSYSGEPDPGYLEWDGFRIDDGAPILPPIPYTPSQPFSSTAIPDHTFNAGSTGSPLNTPIPDDPILHPESEAVVASLLETSTGGELDLGPGHIVQNADETGDINIPIYFATGADPLYTIVSTEIYGPFEFQGQQIHIPDGARPAQGSDHHMSVVQPDGSCFDFWEVVEDDFTGGGEINFSWGGWKEDYYNHVDPKSDVGHAIAAGWIAHHGQIRAVEIEAGEINHAIVATIRCNGPEFKWPAWKNGLQCATLGEPETDKPGMGYRFQLDYTEAEIDALDEPEWKKIIWRAIAKYGLIVGDTTAAHWNLRWESGSMYTALGHNDPWADLGAALIAEPGPFSDIVVNDGDNYVFLVRRGIDWTRLRLVEMEQAELVVVDGEQLILDPAEVAGDRTELDLHSGPISVREEGPDWGDATIEMYLADRAVGSMPVDFKVPNRQIVIPLLYHTSGGTTFEQARARLQGKVGLIQREGGWLKRRMRDGATLYADIVNASLKLGGSSAAAYGWVDADAVLTLETLPDWYGDEIPLSVHNGTGSQLVFTETGIKGDFPLGNRCRIVVSNPSDADHLSAIWAFRGRHYSPDPSAALAWEAEDLDVLGGAEVSALTGASGGVVNNVVSVEGLTDFWQPVVGAQPGSSEMTHVGIYRMLARVSASGTAVRLRLVYDVGDLVNPAINPEVAVPSGGFRIVDLGEVRLDRTGVGPHVWGWELQARGSGPISIDRCLLVPVAESSGVLRAASASAYGISTPLAEDDFGQTAGALTGKTASSGQTYAAVSGSDSDDFQVTGAGLLRRSAQSDASLYAGRYVRLGTMQPSVVSAELDVYPFPASGVTPGTMLRGVFVRLVNINNWLMAALDVTDLGSLNFRPRLRLLKRVGGGTPTTLASLISVDFAGHASRIGVAVDSEGNCLLHWAAPAILGGEVTTDSATDEDCATGGAIGLGYVGVYDAYIDSTSGVNRDFDNLRVAAPKSDFVVRADGTCEIRTEGPSVGVRDTNAGTYGPVGVALGDRPRLPQGTAEVLVTTSRSDLDTRADTGLDPLAVQVFHRPCWLTVPTT